jgi:hypothetical protein
MNAYIYAQAWLSTGEYIQNCDRCTRLSPNSMFKRGMIDSVGQVYNKIFPKDLYKKKYIPSDYFFSKAVNTRPYIIRTLYKIIKTEAVIVFQTQITFDKIISSGTPEVYDIRLYSEKYINKLNDALVINLFHQKLNKDRTESSGPPVKD